jgi:hypothetical protein
MMIDMAITQIAHHPKMEKGTKYPATNPSTPATAIITILLGFFPLFGAFLGMAL